jgi:hypothetical protein
MTSKGVDFYTFASDTTFNINLSAPGNNNNFTNTNNYKHGNWQIDSSNISGITNYTGTFSWTVSEKVNGTSQTIKAGSQEISSLTGNLGAGTMKNMLTTPSLFGAGYAVSYGFYDAGSGALNSLTNQDQFYVYVTKNYKNWMGDLANKYPQVNNAPFYQFALAGAHDAGMFTIDTVNQLLTSPSGPALWAMLVTNTVLTGIMGPVLTAGEIPTVLRAITNLALTQKEPVANMLNLGVRYFDFRPGNLAPGVAPFSPNVRYHQHAIIPGYPYIAFLQDVLQWLAQNPSEIVVVSANVQGIPTSLTSMFPTADELNSDLTAAYTNTGLSGEISAGNQNDLNTTYSALLTSKKRLIFLNQISKPPATTKYDSYNSKAYTTVTPAPIINQFNQMSSTGQIGFTYTVLQMQATSSGLPSTVGPSILTVSDASSPLMSTKASFDIVTNPWLIANAAKNLTQPQLLVLLNDFVDNCMVDTSIQVTMQRMGLIANTPPPNN